MAIRSADDIIKRARQMEINRIASERPSEEHTRAASKRLDVLEAKLDMVMQKLGIEAPKEEGVHARLLDALVEWRSTRDLAAMMGYRQEYVSRCVAELKRTGRIESKKQGKTVFYRKVA